MEGGQDGLEGPDGQENQVYGDYEIIKPIGKGKFAVVYRARRRSDGETVALKRISVDMIDQKARDKCLKEVRLLQSLDHPNIIQYMDSFISDNDLVIVFEWAAAGDLKRQLRKAQERNVGFDERLIWKYFSQICDAIRHMHEKRIMHRDLKPANIFLTLDGTIKVGDLGLSRELSEHTVQAHSKVGTPLYMSPEVLRGDGYDFKSDVWSLGCLLYELAMLKSPFKSEGLNLFSLFQKISQGQYEQLPETYSEELRTLAYAMISTRPEDRPDIGTVCEEALRMRQLTAEKNRTKKDGIVAAGNSNTNNTIQQRQSADFGGDGFVEVSRQRSDEEDRERGEKLSSRANGGGYPVPSQGRNHGPPEAVDYNRQRHGQQEVSVDKGRGDSRSRMPSNTSIHNLVTVPFFDPIERQSNDDDLDMQRTVRVNAVNPVTSAPVLEEGITSTTDGFSSIGASFYLMEMAYSKLIILKYPFQMNDNRKFLLPYHFICNLTLLGSLPKDLTRGHVRDPGSQFRTYIEVCSWIFQQIQAVDSGTALRSTVLFDPDIDSDQPMTVTKQLLLAAENIGVPHSEIVNISPTSLIEGYGDKACTLLNSLADALLRRKRHSWLPFIYEKGKEDQGGADGLDQDQDEEVEEEEVVLQGLPQDELGSDRDTDNAEGLLLEPILMASVAPTVWKSETERVARRLAEAKMLLANGGGGQDWEQRVALVSGEATKHWVDGQGDKPSEVSETATGLTSIGQTVRENIKIIHKQETILNSQPRLVKLSEEYSLHKQELIKCEERSQESTKKVEALSSCLSELEEKISDVEEKLKSKMDGSSESGGGNPAVQIKGAIQTVKEDIQIMSVMIGIVSNEIMNRRATLAKESVHRMKKKRRPGNARSGGNGRHTAIEEGENSFENFNE